MGSVHRVSDSMDLRWSKRIYTSTKFPGDAHAVDLGPTLEEASPSEPSSPLPREKAFERELQKKMPNCGPTLRAGSRFLTLGVEKDSSVLSRLNGKELQDK